MSSQTDSNCIIEKRIKRFICLLKKNNLQNLVILKDENIFYLTGFYGSDTGSILLLTENHYFLLVNFIFFEEARKAARGLNIEVIEYRSGQKYEKLAEILGSFAFPAVNMESHSVSLREYEKFEKVFRKIGKRVSGTTNMVERLRIQKDTSEIELIEKACMITDRGFDYLLDMERGKLTGTSEIILSRELELKMVKEGADGKSFELVIASGKNSSKPHYSPGHNNITDGVLLMDFGCRFKNYCSDITRTIFINKIKNPDKFKKIYDIVLQAQMAAIETCREGKTCEEVDNAARKIIEDRGFGRNFGHGTGHGVGLDVHEKPYLTPGNKEILKEDMVVTIEPGIYIEDFGGVRIEDMVVVGKAGCRVLYRSKKDIIILK